MLKLHAFKVFTAINTLGGHSQKTEMEFNHFYKTKIKSQGIFYRQP